MMEKFENPPPPKEKKEPEEDEEAFKGFDNIEIRRNCDLYKIEKQWMEKANPKYAY